MFEKYFKNLMNEFVEFLKKNSNFKFKDEYKLFSSELFHNMKTITYSIEALGQTDIKVAHLFLEFIHNTLNIDISLKFGFFPKRHYVSVLLFKNRLEFTVIDNDFELFGFSGDAEMLLSISNVMNN